MYVKTQTMKNLSPKKLNQILTDSFDRDFLNKLCSFVKIAISIMLAGNYNCFSHLLFMNQSTDRTMRCPFDPNHVMPYDRFLNHLDKCKFPDKKSYLKCRYNPYHVIHKDLMAAHENKCNDRHKYEEDSDDDWGAEEEEVCVPEKREKSTVSTSITVATSNCHSANFDVKEQRQVRPMKTPLGVEDFDAQDFSKRPNRR